MISVLSLVILNPELESEEVAADKSQMSLLLKTIPITSCNIRVTSLQVPGRKRS